MVAEKRVGETFLYAEECGLALFEHKRSGRRFYVPVEAWTDVVRCLEAGSERPAAGE